MVRINREWNAHLFFQRCANYFCSISSQTNFQVSSMILFLYSRLWYLKSCADIHSIPIHIQLTLFLSQPQPLTPRLSTYYSLRTQWSLHSSTPSYQYTRYSTWAQSQEWWFSHLTIFLCQWSLAPLSCSLSIPTILRGLCMPLWKLWRCQCDGWGVVLGVWWNGSCLWGDLRWHHGCRRDWLGGKRYRSLYLH